MLTQPQHNDDSSILTNRYYMYILFLGRNIGRIDTHYVAIVQIVILLRKYRIYF